MNLQIQGKGKVTLSKSDFAAAGGEGSVYVRGATAYKLYGAPDAHGGFAFAPHKMIPLGKIQELSGLSLPDIIRPEDALLDGNGTPVGYTMRAVTDAVCLCQTFPKAYRDRNHLSADDMLRLVQTLQAGVRHVHDAGVLIVDLNEMNFLVDKTHQRVFFIDVDSYQTVHFPATALMDSVRDRHSAVFSKETDWFSFGIVSFQMLMGIHPYKGKHDTLKTLDERMQNNVSVLNASVRLPAVAPPLTVIPEAWRDWYRAVFERGVRIAPPDGLTPVVALAPVTTIRVAGSGSDNFDIEDAGRFDGAVVSIWGAVTLTASGVYVGARRVGDAPPGAVLGVTPLQNAPVLAHLENGKVILTDVLRKQTLPLDLAGQEVTASDGRIYVRQNDKLLEVTLTELPNRLLAGVQVVGQVLGQATRLFEGVAIQNLLGAAFAGLLPASGRFVEVRVPELDTYRIVDARYERGVLAVAGEKGGRYDRLVFRFDERHASYDVRQTGDVAAPDINFAVLDSGVVALMNENETLELFAKTPGSATVKQVPDREVGGDCRLFRHGAQTLIARGDRLYKITMRKSV